MLGKPERELKESDRQQLGVVLSDAGFSEYLQVKDVSLSETSLSRLV